MTRTGRTRPLASDSRPAGRRWIPVVADPASVVGIAATAFYFGKQFLSGIGDAPDYAGGGDMQVNVRINSGDPLSTIATTLEDADVVKSAKSFTEAAKGNSKSSSIQPGLYSLKTKMKATAALDLLLSPEARLTRKVTIPEGYTVAQVLAATSKKTEVPLEDLKAALTDVQNLGLPAWLPNANVVLEGFLAPGTYEFDPDDTPLEIVQEMVARFQQLAGTVGLEDGAKALGQSPYNVFTIASLIETVTLAEGLPRRVLSAVDGERRLTDLRHVGQLLHAAATTEGLGTTALTSWLRRRIAEAERETGD